MGETVEEGEDERQSRRQHGDHQEALRHLPQRVYAGGGPLRETGKGGQNLRGALSREDFQGGEEGPGGQGLHGLRGRALLPSRARTSPQERKNEKKINTVCHSNESLCFSLFFSRTRGPSPSLQTSGAAQDSADAGGFPSFLVGLNANREVPPYLAICA